VVAATVVVDVVGGTTASVVAGTGIVVVDDPSSVDGTEGAQADATATRPISKLLIRILTLPITR
jgi:hypothetical protein